MGWKKSMLAASVGVIGGYFLQKRLSDGSVSPEKALKCVKQTVGQKYRVDGSWVHMESEAVHKNGLEYIAYRGGITVSEEDQVKHYHFLVDAKTGTVLEFAPDEV
ncbi:MAG TPA: PepSY domain-containing protein [Bacillales bacterium]|nr:PepSY domain-containing protein [Bacillales bacterium]